MEEQALLTLDDWRQAYRQGALPRDLLPAHLRRLRHQAGPEWISLVDEAALTQRLDALAVQAASGTTGLPLYGVPFAVKDNIDVAGLPTTAACPAFAYRPEASAEVVRRLEAAGAVCLGKTNLDQFATGLVGARSPYGRPASALVPDRVSGGSSAGSAVSVARGQVAFSLGTDTAGSGRVPAAFNNIVGLKPTPGRVSTRGVVPACRSIDCVSVFAQTVADAAQVLAVIEGPDEGDPYSGPRLGPATFPARLRIGVPDLPGLDEPGYVPLWAAAVAQMEALGHEVHRIDMTPLHDVAALLYDGPWVAERHAVVQTLLERQPEVIDPVVRQVIERATGLSATDTFRAQYRLRQAQADTAALWTSFDVLMVPTTPAHPTFDALEADPIGANARLGLYTNFVNLLGWCGLALPAGFTPEGLPFGITLLAEGGGDAALARAGLAWQAAHTLPLGATGKTRALLAPSVLPALWPAATPTLKLAVVGAHLTGMPLNRQLTERGAVLRQSTTTAPSYQLFALNGTVPPKPGLRRVADDGAAIEVEVWALPMDQVGTFLAAIPSPLGLGSLQLADGSWVQGFICEGLALEDATDITAFGGWRAYQAHLARA